MAEWDAVLRTERQNAQAAAAHRGRHTPPPPAPEQTTRAHFTAAAMQAPDGYFAALHGQIEQAAQALAQLAATLDARLLQQAPSLAGINASLEACLHAVLELGGTPQQALEEETAVGQETDNMRDRAQPAPLRQGEISGREDAYRRLSEIADYLQRTEPHSPVPHLVRRAVTWGAMPLEELLQELLDSESDLKQIYRLLGTRAK